MTAKKSVRREKRAAHGKKAPARKVPMGRKRLVAFEKHVARELLGPIESAGESVVVAARRLWLSAGYVVTARAAAPNRSMRKARTRVSR